MALPIAFSDADFAELGNELPFIRFRPTTGIGRLIISALSDPSSTPEKQLILGNIKGTVECAKRGLGYTVLPKPDVERYLNDQIVMRSVADQ